MTETLMALRNKHFHQNVKGMTLKLFCTHENLPDLLARDIIEIFQQSRVFREGNSEKYFIAFYLQHFFPHMAFNQVLRFMRRDLATSTIDGLNFFSQHEYNPYNKILFIQLNLGTFLYYLSTFF